MKFTPQPLVLLVACLLATLPAWAQSGCPGCVIDLPELPEDTLFLAPAPDGQAGANYQEDIGFRLPKTTDPVNAVDPDTPAGLTIDEFTIITVSNLPPGLSWEANKLEFDVSNETDGCVQLCGTPLQSGWYFVEVVLDVRIFVITETTSFSFPIFIAPSVTVTEGFSTLNNSGCGTVEASFTNLVPSNGNDGIAYQWDFGNGNLSNLENPPTQIYTEPGAYPISYQATIDTIGPILTQVVVESLSCDDFLGGDPDVRFIIFDPNGNNVFASATIDDATTPLVFDLNFPLDTGTYNLRLIDTDSGVDGGDDTCGSFNFNRSTNGSLANNGSQIMLNTLTPIDTVQSFDTIRVFQQPENPVILGNDAPSYCDGSELTLSTTYDNNVQWYQDSIPRIDGTSETLIATESGQYWVVYTSPDGCIAQSEQVAIPFNEAPEFPTFVNEDNELTVFDLDALPESYSLQWFLDGEVIPDAIETTYCANESGIYELEVTDLTTGCTSKASQTITYNPDFPGCLNTSTYWNEVVQEFTLYPNPTTDWLRIDLNLIQTEQLSMRLLDALGRPIKNWDFGFVVGQNQLSLMLEKYPTGLYLVEIQIGTSQKVFKVFKSK